MSSEYQPLPSSSSGEEEEQLPTMQVSMSWDGVSLITQVTTPCTRERYERVRAMPLYVARHLLQTACGAMTRGRITRMEIHETRRKRKGARTSGGGFLC